MPVTRAQIRAAAPETKYAVGMFEEGNRACSICLEPYSNGQALRCLPCDRRHHFCVQCIDTWLQTNSTCPVCRASLLPGSAAGSAAANDGGAHGAAATAAVGAAGAAGTGAPATVGAAAASTGAGAAAAAAAAGDAVVVPVLPSSSAAAAASAAATDLSGGASVGRSGAATAAAASTSDGDQVAVAVADSVAALSTADPTAAATTAVAAGNAGHSRRASDSPAAATVNPLGASPQALPLLVSPVAAAAAAAAAAAPSTAAADAYAAGLPQRSDCLTPSGASTVASTTVTIDALAAPSSPAAAGLSSSRGTPRPSPGGSPGHSQPQGAGQDRARQGHTFFANAASLTGASPPAASESPAGSGGGRPLSGALPGAVESGSPLPDSV